MEEKFYTIGEVCEILEIPKKAVKPWLRNGLIRGVKRQHNHYRVFSEAQLDLMRMLAHLSQAGTKMPELKKYAALEQSEPRNTAEIKSLLETKKRQMWENLRQLQEGIDLIERRIEVLEQGENLAEK